MRIHHQRLARRDAEEQRIELVDTVDERAPLDTRAALAARQLGGHRAPVPAGRRDLGHAIAAVEQVLPERIRVLGHRHAGAQAHDRDRFVRVGRAAVLHRRRSRRDCRRGGGRRRYHDRVGHRRRRLGEGHHRRRPDLREPLLLGAQQIFGKRLQRREFEEQRRRQCEAECGVEFIRQFGQLHRVIAVFAQCRAQLNLLGHDMQTPGHALTQRAAQTIAQLGGADGPRRADRHGRRGDGQVRLARRHRGLDLDGRCRRLMDRRGHRRRREPARQQRRMRVHQMPRQPLQARVFEEQRRRQFEPELAVDAIGQIGQRDGVVTVFAQLAIEVDHVGLDLDQRGGLLAQVGADPIAQLGRRDRGVTRRGRGAGLRRGSRDRRGDHRRGRRDRRHRRRRRGSKRCRYRDGRCETCRERRALGGQQMLGHALQRREFEEQRRRQIQAELAVQAIGQIGQRHRVVAVIAQFGVELDEPRLDLDEACHLLAQARQQPVQQLGIGDLGRDRLRRGGCEDRRGRLQHRLRDGDRHAGGRLRRDDLRAHARLAGGHAESVDQAPAIAGGDQHLRMSARERRVERGDPGSIVHRREAEVIEHQRDAGLVRTHPAIGPQRPVEREAAALPLAAAHLQFAAGHVVVHERVAGGVVGLPRIAGHAGQRRESREHIERRGTGGEIEVDESAHLRLQHRDEVRLGLLEQISVAQEAGAVQHRGERPELDAQAFDECLHGARVDHVERPVDHPRAERLERGQPRAVELRAAGQHDRAGRAGGQDRAGEHQADRAGPARDQHHALIAPDRCGSRRGRDLDQRGEFAAAAAVAQQLAARGHLRAFGTQQPREPGQADAVGHQHHLGADPRILELRGTQQARQARERGRFACGRQHQLQQRLAAALVLQDAAHRREQLARQAHEAFAGIGALGSQRLAPHVAETVSERRRVDVGQRVQQHLLHAAGRRRGGERQRLVDPLRARQQHAVQRGSGRLRDGSCRHRRARRAHRRHRGGHRIDRHRGGRRRLPGLQPGHPEARLRERIAGQADAVRLRTAVQQGPIHSQALHPHRQQLVELALGDPAVDRVAQIVVAAERGQRLPAGAHIAAVQIGGGIVAAQEGVEPLAQLGHRADHQPEPLVHRLAAGLQREREIGECRLVEREPLAQAPGDLAQLFRVARRQHHQRGPLGGGRGLRRALIFLDQHVRVRSARAERADAGAQRIFEQLAVHLETRPLPGRQLLLHDERGSGEIDVRIEPRGMQRGHQFAVTHLQQHLGDAGDAGRALAMADVRFHRADRAEAGVARLAAEAVRQTGDLDRIAERGTGAVRLDIADGARVHPGALQRAGDHLGLRAGVGHRVGVGLAAVVDRAGLDHAVDVVAVGLGLRERLEQDRTHPLARHVTVAAVAERLATALARHELALAERQILVRMQREIDATGDRHRAFAVTQALAGQMDRRQRRRAHRIEREARPAKVEVVGHAVGDRRLAARQRHAAPLQALFRAVELVFLVHHADEHAHLAARPRERLARVARILEGMEHVLQEHALLRIDDLGIARRDVEEQRIELVDAVDEAAPLAVDCTRLRTVAAVVRRVVPALGRHLGDAVAAGAQVVPERVDVGGHRIAAGQADDRDVADGQRLARRRRRARNLPGQRRRRRARGCRRGRDRRGDGRRRAARAAEHRVELTGMALDEVAGEFGEAAVLEEQRLRQRSEMLLQLAGELDHHDRIEPVFLEWHVGRDLLGRHARRIREQRLQVTLGAFMQLRIGTQGNLLGGQVRHTVRCHGRLAGQDHAREFGIGIGIGQAGRGRDRRAAARGRLAREAARGEAENACAHGALRVADHELELLHRAGRARARLATYPHPHVVDAGRQRLDARGRERQHRGAVAQTAVLAEQERDARLQRRVHHARMQHERRHPAGRGHRQRETRQHGVLARIDGGQPAMARPVGEAQLGEGVVALRRTELGAAHRSAQRVEIERLGHRRRIPARAALAVHAGVAVDAEREASVLVRHQTDVQAGRCVVERERSRPHHVGEHGGSAFRRGRQFGERGARHLQIGDARQHAPALHDVIRQEELLAAQARAQAQAVEVRGVRVQQRMQHRCRARRIHRARTVRQRQPEMLARERVGRQAHPARAGREPVGGPVERGAAHPQRQQGLVAALGGPGRAARRQALVASGRGTAAGLAAAEPEACLIVAAGQIGGQLVARLLEAAGHEGEPLIERDPPDLQRVREIGQRGRVRLAEDVVQRLGHLAQPVGVARRQQHRVRARVGQGRCGGRPGRQVFLDDHVGIRAARAERADARAQRHLAAVDHGPFPWAERLLQHERRGGEVDLRIDRFGMQRRRDLAVFHLHQHLGQAGDAGRALGVTDVRLDRADRAEAGVGGVLAERAREPADLDRIAQRGAGAVRLDVADGARIDAGALERGAHQRGLCRRARHRVAVRLAARVDRGALDQAVDVVAVGDRARQRLEQHRAHALAVDEALRAGTERMAFVRGRQHHHLGERDVVLRHRDQVHAAGDRAIARAAVQALDGQVQRRQRRRARGVDGQARAGEVEQVRDAVGRRPVGRAGGVAAVHDADEHAHARIRVGQLRRRITRVLDHRVSLHQELALLRIHALGLGRRDAEEQRIELREVVEEAAVLAVHRAFLALLFVEVVAPVPALGRDFTDAVTAVAQVLPEAAHVLRLRIAAREADDRDVLARRRRHRQGRRGGARRDRRGRRCGDGCLGRGRRMRLDRRRGDGSRPGARHQRAQGQRVRDEQPLGQPRHARHLEQQRAADVRQHAAQPGRQLHHQHRIDAIAFQRLGRIDLGGRNADHLRHQPAQIVERAGTQRGVAAGIGGGGGRCRRYRDDRLGRHRDDRHDGLADRARRAGRFGRDRCRRLGAAQQRAQRLRMCRQQALAQRVDGRHLEQQRAADVRQHAAQPGRQLHHQHRIDAIAFQRLGRIDLGGRNADHLRHQLAQIVARRSPRQGRRCRCRIDSGARRRASRRDAHAGTRDARRRAGGERHPPPHGARRQAQRHRAARADRLTRQAVTLADDDLLGERARRGGRQAHRAEALGFHRRLPDLRIETGRARQPQRGVVVEPPALEQAEGQMAEQQVVAHLVEQQHAVRTQRGLHVAQRVADIGGGVQHVGGDHHVIGLRVDALPVERLAGIEQPIGQIRIGGPELALRVHQERLRQVGVAVLGDVVLIRTQRREHARAGAAGAGAHLEDAHPRGRIVRHARLHPGHQHVHQHGVEMVGDGIVLVHPLDQLQRRLREHHGGGRTALAENLRQGAQHRLDQLHARAPVVVGQPPGGVALPVGPGRRGIHRPQRVIGPVGMPRDPAMALQHGQGLVEPALVHGGQARAQARQRGTLRAEQAELAQLHVEQPGEMVVHLRGLRDHALAQARHAGVGGRRRQRRDQRGQRRGGGRHDLALAGAVHGRQARDLDQRELPARAGEQHVERGHRLGRLD